jgi:hypothetical protein
LQEGTFFSHRCLPRQSIALLAACALVPQAASAAAPGAKGAAAHAVIQDEGKLDLRLPAESADFMHDLTADLNQIYDRYLAIKDELQDATGVQYTAQVTAFSQWGTAHGGPAAGAIYSPSLTWQAFSGTPAGSGLVTVSLQRDQFFTGADDNSLQTHTGLLATPNDWGSNGHQYTQITYTQTLPGSWLAASAGQYSIGQFDGNRYASNAQANFFNYAMAQNATQTYADAGIGAYLQFWPIQSLQLAAGLQNATDIAGRTFTADGYGNGKVAGFAMVRWAPDYLNGGGHRLLYYSQPGVPGQPGASQGISFGTSYPMNDRYGFFVRANNASGRATPIETSLAAGVIVNNPLGHNRLDQAGLGVAWNQTNRAYSTAPSRASEWVVDGYYNFTVSKAMELGPDLQIYPRPALAPDAAMAAVISLRMTVNL